MTSLQAKQPEKPREFDARQKKQVEANYKSAKEQCKAKTNADERKACESEAKATHDQAAKSMK